MPRPDTSGMEVRVNPKTTQALRRDGTLRCLLQIRYTRHDQHSSSAIAWARRKATEVSRNLLRGAGLDAETATFAVDLTGYKLGRRNHRSYICYDIYLDKCSGAARERIGGSTRQPIHLVTKRGNAFIARRAPGCDSKVALFFETLRKCDQTPRQVFPGVENTPVFRDGRHWESSRAATPRKDGESGAVKNKLEDFIRDAAGKVARYIGGNFGEHVINQLELQLHITKVVVAGAKENVNNVTVKSVNPDSEKD